MPKLPSFNSPANQAEKDFVNDQKGLKAFQIAWNNNLNRWTNQAILGNPWLNENDRYAIALRD